MGIDERKQREKESRRNLILQTAKQLFFRDGFQAVTVAQIARESELAKGTIYLHYRSKEEIYTQILLEKIDAFYTDIVSLKQKDMDAAASLSSFSHIYIDLFLQDRELFRIMMNFQLYPDRLNLPEQLAQSLVMSMRKNTDAVEEIFRTGVRNGEFLQDIKPFACRNVYWGMLNGIISHYLYSIPQDKANEMIRTTMDTGLSIFIRGLKPTMSYK